MEVFMAKSFSGPFVRSAYNYDPSVASDESALRCEDPSLTSQEFKDDNDPNVIMAKFARDHDMSPFNTFQPQYSDFLDAPVSYHAALNQVHAANAAFMALPAALRSRFGNDPANFVAFVDDDKNISEAIELGILKEGFKLPSEEGSSSSPLPQGRDGEPSPTPPKGGKSSSRPVKGGDE